MALYCRADAAHLEFEGTVAAFTEYAAVLGPDGAVVRLGIGKAPLVTSDPSFGEIRCVACGVVVRHPYPKINFIPRPGMVLLCNFSPGFAPPEMVKFRPVVVVSLAAYNHNTATVVPLSTEPPLRMDRTVLEIGVDRYPFLRESGWAKGGMVTTVGHNRLYRLVDRVTRRQLDSRVTVLEAADLAAVRDAIKVAVGA